MVILDVEGDSSAMEFSKKAIVGIVVNDKLPNLFLVNT